MQHCCSACASMLDRTNLCQHCYSSSNMEQLLYMQMLAGAQSGRTTDNSTRMEVRGIIPPWCLHRLARVLQEAHADTFQVITPRCMTVTPLFQYDIHVLHVAHHQGAGGLSLHHDGLADYVCKTCITQAQCRDC